MSKFRKWESILLVAVFGVAYIFWFYPTFAGVTPNNPVMDLAQKKSCLACHNIERKMVGPAWKDIAKKGEPVEVLVKSIKEGSMGKWGQIPMPPQSVTDAEAKMLAEFIRGL